MEKTPCLVSVESAFAESKALYEGSFEEDGERVRISWCQPEEEKGEGDSRFLLSYRVSEKVLRMTRRGATESEMTFQAGEKTEGIMRTAHGDFDLQMETSRISFFEEDEEIVEEEGRKYLLKRAYLDYEMCFPNQDPMPNTMIFEIRIAK
ncbi:MAG: DUF1934 domain-containing protein [Clostridiales bacterium]|nr:DUF1934 domain-containing protein [Clostridiales bacterium]